MLTTVSTVSADNLLMGWGTRQYCRAGFQAPGQQRHTLFPRVRLLVLFLGYGSAYPLHMLPCSQAREGEVPAHSPPDMGCSHTLLDRPSSGHILLRHVELQSPLTAFSPVGHLRMLDIQQVPTLTIL